MLITVPEGAEADFDYKPGQFLTLAVPSDQTGVAARCYSLSSSPHDGGPLTVTVKRTSTARLQLDLRQPARGVDDPVAATGRSSHRLRWMRSLLLFAGGSGITPIMSIARTAIAHGSGKIMLFYANADEQSVISPRSWREWRPSTRTGWSSCTGWCRCRGFPPRSR